MFSYSNELIIPFNTDNTIYYPENDCSITSNWGANLKSLNLENCYGLDIYIETCKRFNTKRKQIYSIYEPRAINNFSYQFIEKNYSLFDSIFTFDETLLNICPNAIKALPCDSWVKPLENKIPTINKISSVVGAKNWCKGHILRQQLYFNFKNLPTIDFFISSQQPVINLNNFNILPSSMNSKELCFKEYEFHLAIENSRQNNYFTEKLMDCMLTKTVPIYWGAPNIAEYFDTRGMIILNTSNIDEIINIINCIPKTFYIDNLEFINYNYNKALYYYNHECLNSKIKYIFKE